MQVQDTPDPNADLSDDLEELKALTSELIAQGRAVDDLKQVPSAALLNFRFLNVSKFRSCT